MPVVDQILRQTPSRTDPESGQTLMEAGTDYEPRQARRCAGVLHSWPLAKTQAASRLFFVGCALGGGGPVHDGRTDVAAFCQLEPHDLVRARAGHVNDGLGHVEGVRLPAGWTVKAN